MHRKQTIIYIRVKNNQDIFNKSKIIYENVNNSLIQYHNNTFNLDNDLKYLNK